MRRSENGKWDKGVSGFTLVELLAAIGIIAVLASLVLVSMGKFKESSLRTTCAANLRQIGSAATLYAGDNDGSYPYTYGVASGMNYSTNRGLIECLGDYVNGDYRIFYCTDVVHCLPPPDLDQSMTFQSMAAAPGRNRFSYIGYYWLPSTDQHWQALPQKANGSIKRVFATCFSYGRGAVHNRLQNMLYADGHVIQKQSPSGSARAFVDAKTLLMDPVEESN